ncbi:MAG: dihydroorotase [Armatimonadota bacterium]
MMAGDRPDKLLISGGRVVDPATGTDAVLDVLIADGAVAAIDGGISADGANRIDAAGKIVCPGLIDMHVHLREPGGEHKETVRTGTRAAVAGGFTTVCCRPNTDPPLDCLRIVEDLQQRIDADAACRVHVIGAATVGNEGEALTDYAGLKRAGCVAVSDDAFPIQSAELMQQALAQCAEADLPFIAHCELKDSPTEPAWRAEADSIQQWCRAAMAVVLRTGLRPRLHIAHLSTAEGQKHIREAKHSGAARITAETAPHYWLLTKDALDQLGPDAKMNPPLREAADVEATKRALADGAIDVIATDHAPHAAEEKAAGVDAAPFGVVGLETAVGLVLTGLVEPGVLSVADAIARMTIGPAEALGLPRGRLAVGEPADVTIIDPEAQGAVDPAKFESKARSMPFAGWELHGAPFATIVGGEVRMLAGRVEDVAAAPLA